MKFKLTRDQIHRLGIYNLGENTEFEGELYDGEEKKRFKTSGRVVKEVSYKGELVARDFFIDDD